ncbi:MAG: cellulose synthase/poly-beta-1,6-N-acetylglucosamine synthase-like glycosyltransferase [Arenicella sp.]|jgi:cellulose synthase/poly-beta-1,6-N-acetylglucosamine synthase-like glycosyltransferase
MPNLLFYLLSFFNFLLLIYVLQECYLLFNALKKGKEKQLELPNELPFITIQLPLYNEKYVVERLLKAVSKFDYPKNKLEIQILDDSTDETSELIKAFLESLEGEQFDFQHICREKRVGYKAGALDYGLGTAKGEFIAIFDADFIPEPDFLFQTISHFQNPKIGLVQTRWTYINEDDSMLTKAQALMLNTHFSIEHLGRINANGFINFNGTAGIWRRTCIDQAGGWQADTLTEDLDLSFRAQMKGWQFKYLFEVGSPSELPMTFSAFRSQQFRWSKGAAECLRKSFRQLWQSDSKPIAKLIGTFHLLNSSVYLLVIGILLLSPAVYYFRQLNAIDSAYLNELSLLGPLVLGLLFLIFLAGSLMTSKNKLRSLLTFIPSLFVYFSMTTGISLYMLMGILEGYRGKQSEFIRTPKFGMGKGLLSRVKTGYDSKRKYSILILEIIALGYGLFWIVSSLLIFNPLSLSYGLVVFFGFSLSVFFKDWSFRWKK